MCSNWTVPQGERFQSRKLEVIKSAQAMDWFEKLTGFTESTGVAGYEKTRQRLEVDGSRLKSLVNGRSYGVGELELVSLHALRERAAAAAPNGRRSTLRIVSGGVRPLHAAQEYRGALFQVASQFNLLEMMDENVIPEHGVTIYNRDPTQGPACAIAAGAATIYRNYFAPVRGSVGQTKQRQIDGFSDLGAAVAREIGKASESLWTMRNGYAMFTSNGVDSMSAHIRTLDESARDELRRRLQIGLHWDVEVTDALTLPGPTVSQAFCSALPVSYNNRTGTRGADWKPMASLVLEAAYEATLWAAAINLQRGSSSTVLLTLVGGGVFGNDVGWIRSAMRRAIERVDGYGLDVVLVTLQVPSVDWQQWVNEFHAGGGDES